MRDVAKGLLAGNVRTVLEDAAGLVALFILLFAVLALPGSV